jgi:nucleotide-binding universal stress UspA family protein
LEAYVPLRDILVHVDQSPEGAQRVRLAVDLAARHRAHLTILHIREQSLDSQGLLKAADLGLVPASSRQKLADEIDTRLTAEAEKLSIGSAAETEARGVEGDFISVSGRCEIVIPQYARYADVAIVGHGGEPSGDMPEGFPFGEAILFATGRPVLLVPPSVSTETLGDRVALAWNGSRPAARALTDAMPILEHADETLVLTAYPIRAPTNAALPPEAILTHLRRHCVTVSLHSLVLSKDRVGDGLQAEALRLGADLLVAGAYGHPKLWERLLGGVTRDLLAHLRLPVLMAD